MLTKLAEIGCYGEGVNCGFGINDVVNVKWSVGVRLLEIEKNYIIEEICNGLMIVKDTDNTLYLVFACNLIYVGHIRECIEFKDKSLCLI